MLINRPIVPGWFGSRCLVDADPYVQPQICSFGLSVAFVQAMHYVHLSEKEVAKMDDMLKHKKSPTQIWEHVHMSKNISNS